MNTLAESLYDSRYSIIKRYVDTLASTGVDRGLIGPREVRRLWERHIFNSIALSSLIPDGSRIVDVGSGAGLPGIPLAVLRPDLDVTLLEPLLRRSTFLTETVEALKLDAVHVVRGRAEDHRVTYDVVIARAVAPLARLIGWCSPLRSPTGLVLALKGQSAKDEVQASQSVLKAAGLAAEVLTVRAHADADAATVVRIGPAG